jgi:uncharacterized protein YoxC
LDDLQKKVNEKPKPTLQAHQLLPELHLTKTSGDANLD